MKYTFSKLFWAGIVLIFLGLVSGAMERLFYNTIDENGILQESFFLPLSFIFIFIGALLIISSCLKSVFLKIRRKKIN